MSIPVNPCKNAPLPPVLDRVEVQTVPANVLRDIENADVTATCESLRQIVQNLGTKANVDGAGVLTHLSIEQLPVYTILSVRQSRKPLLPDNMETNPANPLNYSTVPSGIQSTQVDAYTDILKINNYNAAVLQE